MVNVFYFGRVKMRLEIVVRREGFLFHYFFFKVRFAGILSVECQEQMIREHG